MVHQEWGRNSNINEALVPQPHTSDWLFDQLSPCRCLRELKIWRERSEDLDGLALDLSFKLANGLAKLSNLRQLCKLDF